MIHWPWRRRAVDTTDKDERAAVDERVRAVTERAERVVPKLIAAREANHFAERIRATLRGSS